MATEHNTAAPTGIEKESNGVNGAHHRNHHHDYSQMNSGFAEASGASLNPGLWKPQEHRKFANPAPLGLSAFALTTFVLSLINLETRGVEAPNIVLPIALAYGGLVQLLAGMWEIACGNTFGATALSSYGGFWIAYGFLLTPGFQVAENYKGPSGDANAVGFFLTGWFIFTTLLLLCTLRSTVAFFFLFFTLDLAFLMLACESYAKDNGKADIAISLKKAGGGFGIIAAFLAWYNALAGMQDSSNSFFQVPVIHFPWSDKGREQRGGKSERNQA